MKLFIKPIEYLNLYPISAYGKFFVQKDWNVKSPYLEDDKGNIYACKEFGTGDNTEGFKEVTCDFQSPYFKKIKKLYLRFTYKKGGVDKKIKIELKQR